MVMFININNLGTTEIKIKGSLVKEEENGEQTIVLDNEVILHMADRIRNKVEEYSS